MSDDKPISVTFPSGQVASKIVNLVLHNKPIGVSRRSQYPYYKEDYAKWVQKSVDQMIETRNELIYEYTTFCNAQTNISPLTLYARVSQGLRFLCDQMDTTEAKYKTFYAAVEIGKDKKRGGVTIIWKPEFVSGSTLQPRLAEPVKETPRWRRELNDWLESDSQKPFVKESVMLDDETVRELNAEFDGVQGLLVSISHKSIKIIKTL